MDLDQFVTAKEYIRLARIPMSGRTLQRWCDDNPFLGPMLREMRTPRRRLFDGRTAPDFRQHWIAAQAELRRAEAEADERLDDNVAGP